MGKVFISVLFSYPIQQIALNACEIHNNQWHSQFYGLVIINTGLKMGQRIFYLTVSS